MAIEKINPQEAPAEPIEEALRDVAAGGGKIENQTCSFCGKFFPYVYTTPDCRHVCESCLSALARSHFDGQGSIGITPRLRRSRSTDYIPLMKRVRDGNRAALDYKLDAIAAAISSEGEADEEYF